MNSDRGPSNGALTGRRQYFVPLAFSPVVGERVGLLSGCPIQAFFWLEWGSSIFLNPHTLSKEQEDVRLPHLSEPEEADTKLAFVPSELQGIPASHPGLRPRLNASDPCGA
jgi:hypothetical protein